MSLARMTLAGLGAIAVVTAGVLGAGPEPELMADARGALTISRLPPILGDADVARHLDSGLTTSLVLQVRAPAALKPAGARVDVRLELWEEVYLVAVIDGSGRFTESRHESKEALEEWWSGVEILLALPEVPPRPGVGARVSLAVVPFSQAELVDTQKWLAESIGGVQGGVGSAGRSRAVEALIATSMQRRAVHSISWSLEVERKEPR